MANDENQPDWSNLPTDLLLPIGKRTRDAVKGLAAFRSVCRAWRAAVGPAPFLLRPRAGPSSEDALVFPLSHGWCIVVDGRDASCCLLHLPTGATAALPELNAVRRADSDVVVYTAVRTWMLCESYLGFTDHFRFAVHAPPGGDFPTTAVSAASMTIMLNHWMLGPVGHLGLPGTGMLCCRPGDAAWTWVSSPFPAPFGYFDFAYHDGKMFGMDSGGRMMVFDAVTLHALCIVQPPPATPNLANKMYGIRTKLEEFSFVHLVALPSKLVLVRTSVKSQRPVAFDVFELASSTPDGLAWVKVRDAGNYELFLDGYHTTFRKNNDGTRIYYVHDVATADFLDEARKVLPVAYCYSMQDNKLECIYMPKEDIHRCSTKPSWFVP